VVDLKKVKTRSIQSFIPPPNRYCRAAQSSSSPSRPDAKVGLAWISLDSARLSRTRLDRPSHFTAGFEPGRRCLPQLQRSENPHPNIFPSSVRSGISCPNIHLQRSDLPQFGRICPDSATLAGAARPPRSPPRGARPPRALFSAPSRKTSCALFVAGQPPVAGPTG